MKFFVAFAILAASMAKVALANTAQAHVHVSCKDVDFQSLTEAEKDFSAESLMLAYNQVQSVATSGDEYLAMVVWDDTVRANKSNGSGSLGQHNFDDGGYYGDWGCNLCGGNDCIDDYYQGMYPDDMLCSNNLGMFGQKYWQDLYMQKLHEGPYTAFHNINGCIIGMALDPVTDFTEQEFDEIKTAEIHVDCTHGSFSGLSDEEMGYSAQTLMKTYNNLYNGDKVVFDLDASGDGYAGVWGGKDPVGGLRASKNIKNKNPQPSAKELEEWARMYVFGLNKSKYSALHGLDECAITLTLTDEVKDHEAAVKMH